jgi:hypothetical protein
MTEIYQGLSLNQYTYEFIVTCMFNVSRTSGSVYFFLNLCVYHRRLDWPCYTHDLPCCRLTRSMFHDNFVLFQPQHGVLTNKDHIKYKKIITLTLIAFIRLSQLSNSSLKTGFWNDRVTHERHWPCITISWASWMQDAFYSLRLHNYKVGQR